MPAWLKRKRVWIPGAMALLLAAYAAFGFWWAPRLVRDALVRDGSAALGVPVAVGEVSVHPFTLEMTVRDLVVDDPAQPLLALERIYVDLEAASLWREHWTFKIVRINGPFARAIIRPDGSLNLGDLVPAPDPAAAEAPLPAVAIGQLIVSRGKVNFADRSRRRQPEKTLSPIQFELADFRTTPEGGGFTLSAASEAGEQFHWAGRVSLQPVSSQGRFEVRGLKARSLWEFVSEQLPFELAQGELSLDGDYAFRLNEPMQLDVNLPRVTGSDLVLREIGADTDPVRLPSVAIEGTRLSWQTGRIDVDAVTIAGAKVQAWRERDGRISLERLFAGVPADVAERVEPVAAQAAAPDWQVRLQRFEFTDASVDFEDRAVQPAVKFAIAPLALSVQDIGLDLERALPVVFDARIDGATAVHAQGQLTPAPLAADLQVTLAGLSLPKLRPYLGDIAVDLASGTASASGQVRLAPEGETPWLRYTGEASVDALRAVDRAQQEELVSWQALQLSGIDLALGPDAVRVQRITAQRPFLRAVVAPDQTLNVVRVMSPQVPGEPAEPAPAIAVPTVAADTAPGMPICIDELRIRAATLSFADQFIQPNFQARIESLDGSVRGLSTAANARAKVDLAGFVVNKFSPVTIQGELNPFRYDQDTALKLAFRNIDLPVFNPYSGRYAGFAIAKGKLTTELDYRIRDRQLVAGHRVILDQLEWGEATDSQDKVSLPIRLATSLLKDRHGVIDLDLPVTGTLDDPKFRVGPVVWQIVKNLVVKIVTAPFAFLGSLFEGAEDAQFVVFVPGEGALTPEQQASLAALAKGLAERPQLRIDVPAGLVPDLDTTALTERHFLAALAQQAGAGDAPFAFEALPADEQIDLLRDLYKTRFGQRAKIPDEPEPPEDADRAARRALRDAHEVAWLTAELLPMFVPADTELTALGQARAMAIQEALLAGGELEPTRVFVVGEAPLAAKDGKVSLELALQ